MEPMIQVENLCKSFSTKNGTVEAARNISFSIEKGEIFGIIGLSGAGKSTLVSIIVPLAKPGVVTVLMLAAMGIWNEYIVALVMISDPAKQTVPVGVAALFEVQRYSTDWGALFAALVLVLIPTVVLYAIGQRYLIEGINVGGVKG